MATDPVRVEVEGAATLVRTLGNAADELEDLKDGNQDTADLLASVAKGLAPRGATGHLAASVRGVVQKGQASVTADAVYSGVIHWGWPQRNIRAQPFALEAALRTMPQWTELYEKDIQKALDRVKGA